MTMVNERDREKKSGSSICWARDTKKIFKPNKIKNRKETYVKYFGIDTLKGSVILEITLPFVLIIITLKKEIFRKK